MANLYPGTGTRIDGTTIVLNSTQVGGVIITIVAFHHLIIISGGWWYNACTSIHLTGQNTETRKTVGNHRQIYYFYYGERTGASSHYDSWKEARMMLVKL